MSQSRILPWLLVLAALVGIGYVIDHYFVGPFRTDCYINFTRGHDASSERVEHVLRAFLYDVDVLDRPGADPGHTPSLLVTTGAGDEQEEELERVIQAVLADVPEARLEGNDCRQRTFFQ